jgi:hypothetical protein
MIATSVVPPPMSTTMFLSGARSAVSAYGRSHGLLYEVNIPDAHLKTGVDHGFLLHLRYAGRDTDNHLWFGDFPVSRTMVRKY